MTILQWLLTAYGVIGCAYWLVNLVLTVRAVRAVPLLGRLRPGEPDHWPKLSLVVPACDEADTIEAAVQSRLRDGYPNLEVVLIDDRSSDGTSEIVARLAASDPRVRALHIRELPAGWLGKVHALHRGTALATGEWLLFSDADVHVAPGMLCRSVAYALEQKLDHLAVFPEMWPTTFLLDAALATFVRVLCVAGRLWAVPNPRSSASIGVGAFNLVRRAALERTEGFEWLKLEIVDDAALGQMLKRSGARSAVVNGRGCVGLRFYSSVRALAHGAEKSIFGGLGKFSLTRLVLRLLVFLALEAAPFVAVIPAGISWLPSAGVIGAVAALTAQAVACRWVGRPIVPGLFVPIGSALMLAISLRAGGLAVRRGGLLWRGTLYPTRLLRQGARFKFP